MPSASLPTLPQSDGPWWSLNLLDARTSAWLQSARSFAASSTRLSLARLLWTYRFPFAWDGAVSCLGAYEPEEMLSLAREAVPAGYIWDAGRKAIPASPAKLCITYLIGEPQLQ